MRKLKFWFVIFLVNVVLFGLAFIVSAYFAESRILKTRAQFLSNDELVFYKKYSDQLNHLRGFDFRKHIHDGVKPTLKDYIFTSVSDGSATILIQGDSWAEQFVTYQPSLASIQNFAEDNDLRVVLSGTSSYSPSLMRVQYRVLRQDFGINPKIVIGVIDQTDIGDELCRYKSQLAMSASGEHIVKPYAGGVKVPYNLEEYFNAIEILDSSGSALLRLLKYKIAAWKAPPIGGCWREILAPLIDGFNEFDKTHFVERVYQYIEEVFRPYRDLNAPEQLVLVTHFHKKHLTGEYQFSVERLVADAISQSKYRSRVTHVNFSPDDYKSEELENIFVGNDVFSHLTDYYHRKVFTKQILSKLKQLFLD
jgi:hypothetical protein